METIAELRKALGTNLTPEMGTFLDKTKQELDLAENTKSDLEKLQTKFSRLEVDNSDMKTELESSIGRHIKASKHITRLQGEVEEAETKLAEHEEKMTRLGELEEKEANQLKENEAKIREEYKTKFDTYKDKEAFGKIKDKVVLPTDEVAIEEIQKSDIELQTAIEYGLFGTVDTRTTKVKEVTNDNPKRKESINRMRRAARLPEIK